MRTRCPVCGKTFIVSCSRCGCEEFVTGNFTFEVDNSMEYHIVPGAPMYRYETRFGTFCTNCESEVGNYTHKRCYGCEAEAMRIEEQKRQEREAAIKAAEERKREATMKVTQECIRLEQEEKKGLELARKGDVYYQLWLGLNPPRMPSRRSTKQEDNASYWFALAIKQGDEALFEGLEKIYRLGKKGDDLICLREIGQLFYEGNGVPRDYAVAAKWFKRAAINPSNAPELKMDKVSQRKLALLYCEGKGLPKDYEAAITLFDCARRETNVGGKDILSEYMYRMLKETDSCYKERRREAMEKLRMKTSKGALFVDREDAKRCYKIAKRL
jgi:Sel1 repeat.